MEHRHCRRIAAAILGCADEHSVALLLDNEEEEAHGTPERCSPAEYHREYHSLYYIHLNTQCVMLRLFLTVCSLIELSCIYISTVCLIVISLLIIYIYHVIFIDTFHNSTYCSLAAILALYLII